MVSKYAFRSNSNNPLFEQSRDEFNNIYTKFENVISNNVTSNKYDTSIPFTQLESAIIRLDYIVENIDYPAGRTDFLDATKDNTLSDIADARIVKLQSWTSIMKHITKKFKDSIKYLPRPEPINYNTSFNTYRIDNIFGDDIIYEIPFVRLSPELRLQYEKEHKRQSKMLTQHFFNRYYILSNIVSNIITLPFEENSPQFSLLDSNIIKLYLGVNKVGFPTWHYKRCLRYCDDKLTDLCIKNIHTWNDNIDNVLLEYKQSNNLLDEITQKQLLQHEYFNKSKFDKHNFKQMK